MSTLTQPEVAGHTDHDTSPAGIISARLVLVLACSLGALTSFYLMMSVTPMYAASAGAGGAGAGLATGVLMFASVAAEVAAPSLMNRYGGASVLALGAVLLGAPTLLLRSAGHDRGRQSRPGPGLRPHRRRRGRARGLAGAA